MTISFPLRAQRGESIPADRPVLLAASPLYMMTVVHLRIRIGRCAGAGAGRLARARRERAPRSRGTSRAASRPDQTPPAQSPDPYCDESYAERRAAPAGRGSSSGSARGWPASPGPGRPRRSSPRTSGKRDRALRELSGKRPMTRAAQPAVPGRRQGRDRARSSGMARHYASLGLRRRAPGPLPPGPRARRRHRRLARLRAPGRARLRADRARGLAADHQRGQHRFLPQHLRRRLRERGRGARARGARRPSARPTGVASTSSPPGFNYAWRFGDADADFWRAVGAAGGKRLRRATDWVGIDAYPGTFVPPAIADPGDALLEAVAQVRECYMPLAGFGRADADPPRGARLPHRARAAARRRRRAALRGFVRTLHRYRGTYGITNVELVRAARQQQRRPQLPVVLRAAARRLLPQAGVR